MAPGLRDGFPWHRPEVGHPALDSPEAWWSALYPVLHGAYVCAGVEPGLAWKAAEAVRECYTDPLRWIVFPDTVALLEDLARAGWRHVLVSNHVPELDRLLAGLGLHGRFVAVVNSAQVGWEKPHRQIFEAALERADHPDRIWMVGDDPVADIAGAGALGIPAILVNPHHDGLGAVRDTILGIA